MLWGLIRSASLRHFCLTEALLMSTHNICFHGEIRKIAVPVGGKKCLIWSCGTRLNVFVPPSFLLLGGGGGGSI